MKRMLLCYTLTTLSLLITVSNLHAQTHFKSDIEKALAEKRIDDADEILHRAFENYLKEKSTDSIVELIFYVGKVNQLKSGKEAGVKAVQNLLISIKTLTKNPGILRQAYINAGEYYGSAGMNQLGYNSNLEAKRFSLIDPSKTGSEIALTENNLSTYAQRLGNVNLTELHGRQSLKYILSDKNPDPETSYISFNGMGSIMWYASKTDSALYFFHKALDALSKTKRTPRNQFFRPAIVENNLSALYQLEGKTTLAVEAMKSTIENLRKYIASDEPAPKKATAITFQFEATDNLAGIYQELGNYNKAQNLFEYSYSQKQLNLEPDDPAIFISQILLGKLYFAQRNEDKALQFLNNGLKNISASDGDYLFWQADAYYTLALLYGKRKDIARATEYYHQADKLYNESFQGTFDNIYLDFLQNESLFYAENNHNQEALKKANAAYRYVVQHQGAGTLSAFLQLLNLAEISNITGNFRASLDYSLKGLEVVNKLAATSDNLLDSIRIELKKPTAILQKGKAEYALMKNKNAENLSLLLEDMNKALQILERQKNILTDPKDVSILTADNSSLLEFIKKLNYEFYRITNDQSYIDRLMGLQESGVYNRIRSRLDKNDSLAFSRVPLSVRDTERKLKQLINDALKGEGTHEEKMRRYFLAVDNWTAYLAGVKKTYPAYYKMRYATIFKSGESVEKHIPENTSVIRYLIVRYVFVCHLPPIQTNLFLRKNTL